jgi:fatty acid desaturase
LLLLVWSPLILRLSDAAYHTASGLSAQPFLSRWLAVTAALFAISAATLMLRVATIRHDAAHRRASSTCEAACGWDDR